MTVSFHKYGDFFPGTGALGAALPAGEAAAGGVLCPALHALRSSALLPLAVWASH